MSVTVLRPALSALALVAATAAARPAAAQAAPAARAVQTAPRAAAGYDAPPDAARPLAIYHLTAGRGAGLPAQVIVADSAGVLLASYRDADTGAERPLEVAVLGSDLVLQAETPAGLLTLVFVDGQNAAPGVPVRGRWTVGDQTGTLRGRLKD